MNGAGAEEVRVNYVRVTNGTDESWSDRFDGVPVTLKPGETENIPLDMAAHFFGYYQGVKPVDMLRHMARRHGWNSGEFIVQETAARAALAEKFFARFKIEPVTFKLVEDTAPPASRDQPVPALHDDDIEREREPTAVKDLARAGLRQPDEEPARAPGRGIPRADSQGRRRE